MKNVQEDKAERVLSLYSRLRKGKIINKSDEAERFGVSLRTIQRDIADIQNFLQDQRQETGEIQNIVFDRSKNGYRLETKAHTGLSAKEILAAGKIMMESRAFVKGELFPIIHKLCGLCSDEKDRKLVEMLLSNEMHHYIELHHGKKLLDLIWDLEQAVDTDEVLRYFTVYPDPVQEAEEQGDRREKSQTRGNHVFGFLFLHDGIYRRA